MAIKPDWTLGTLTLTAGSTAFTTTGSALKAADIQGGDTLMTQSGAVLVIETITGENSGNLYMPCPASAAGFDQPLRVRYQADGSRLPAATRHLLNELSSGNVAAFAELVGQADMVPIFTGAGMLTLVSTELVGGSSAGGWDATVGLLSGRGAYNDKPAGFRVMVIDNGTERSAVYEKTSIATADWSDPVYFTGPVGDRGERGDSFQPDASGPLYARATYNAEPVLFAYLATDTAELYFREGSAGNWSAPVPFGRGIPGESGRDGNDGEPGSQGLPGEPGRDGNDGEPGSQGLPGKDGAPGNDGEPGRQGLPGKDGVPGAAGSNANVTEQSIRAAGGAIKTEVDTALEGKAGVYTGSDAGEVNFPIGQPILLAGLSAIQRNDIATPQISAVVGAYFNSGSGARLTGIWRAKGFTAAGSGAVLAVRVG